MSTGSGSDAAVAERGRWLAAGAVSLACTGAALLLAQVLTTLEYDFEDGVLTPFEPAQGTLVLFAYTILAGLAVFSGVPWRRWVAVLGYAAGAGWILFFADFDGEVLPGILAGAAGLSIATLTLLIPASVHRFFELHEAAGGRLSLPLGPLESASDAQRWIVMIDRWIDGGVLTPRERARLGRTLESWAASHPEMRPGLLPDLERLTPSRRARAPIELVRQRLRRFVRRSSTES